MTAWNVPFSRRRWLQLVPEHLRALSPWQQQENQWDTGQRQNREAGKTDDEETRGIHQKKGEDGSPRPNIPAR